MKEIYGLDVYKLAEELEETKAWLRKLIRRKVIRKEEVHKYTEIIDELGPKLNAFIKSTKKCK